TEISIPKEENCDTCSGSGAKPGTKKETCSHCQGSGQLNQEQNTPFGRVVNRRACHYCQGTGEIIPDKCTTCGGTGRVKKNVNIQVSIPAGIDEGQQIRGSGKGEYGMTGGARVEIFVVTVNQPREEFTREGDDIFLELSITFAQAALGDEISVPPGHGKVMFTMPAGP